MHAIYGVCSCMLSSCHVHAVENALAPYYGLVRMLMRAVNNLHLIFSCIDIRAVLYY